MPKKTADEILKKTIRVAKRYLGVKEPYPHQERAWKALAEGRSVFLVSPTASGKTAAFLGPCIARSGLGIVVSPLLSLMREQVERLKSAGVKAERLGVDLSRQELRRILRKISDGSVKILYVAPERLRNADFLKAIKNRKIGTIAADECHSISCWAKEFRPAYRDIGLFRRHALRAPIIAVTATADTWIETDVVQSIRLISHERIVTPHERPNLIYRAGDSCPPEEIWDCLLEARKLAHEKGGAIVYCATRKNTEKVARSLKARAPRTAFAVDFYHAGLSPSRRKHVQDAFSANELTVIVATNAFGMGIDQPNVRLVYHQDVPENMSAYSQESGRSGRDGLPAICFLNVTREGVNMRKFLMRVQNPSFYAYQRLWDRLRTLRNGGRTLLTTDRLDKIAGTKIPGQSLSALKFMQFKRNVTVSSGPRVYLFPVLSPERAQNVLSEHSHRGKFLKDGRLRILLAPDQSNAVVDALISSRAVLSARPDEQLIIERSADKLLVSFAEVREKALKAERDLDEVLSFARTEHKAGFIRSLFLK